MVLQIIRLLSLYHVEADIEPPSPSYCLASWGTCLVLLQCSCIKRQGMNLVEIDEITNGDYISLAQMGAAKLDGPLCLDTPPAQSAFFIVEVPRVFRGVELVGD